MSKTTNKSSPEVRERAVRLVLDTEGLNGSRGQVIVSFAPKTGCSARAPRQQPRASGRLPMRDRRLL